MNNLPLQPLVWQDLDEDPMLAPVSISESPLHHYVVLKDGEGIKVRYSKKGADFDYATGFATIEEAKAWAWNHYNEKMQPYVKPMPTWIDVNERLPERKELLTDKDKCLVLTECGKVWTGFYNMHIKPDDWYLHGWTEKQGWHPFEIVAWMLASEFSTMQNNKGER